VNDLTQLEAKYQDLLYQLLPQVYRSQDSLGELQDFVALFGHELARLRANMDQLQRDFYIDSCQEWVIPYIGDLVGTTVLFNQGARNRADVKNTIRWRREKGTLAGLEDIAAQITEWGALAAEMFQELIWSQNLNHVRSRALWTVNLSDPVAMAKFDTPMDDSCRTVDFRPVRGITGAYQISNVGFWLWTLPSNPVTGVDPQKEDSQRYYFSPLKRNQVLYAGGDKPDCTTPTSDADICLLHADHLPIRGRDFSDHTEQYWGANAGFGIYEDGILLCEPATAASGAALEPAIDFAELASAGGLLVADAGLFAAKQFRISAMRLRQLTVTRTDAHGNPYQDPVPIVPVGPFANNYQIGPNQASVDSTAMAFTKGTPFDPTLPELDQIFLVLRIETLGADPNFPECELILRNSTGESLLVFLPAIPGLAAGQMHFYVAVDGSVYYARSTHDAGDINLNPNSALLGAFLPRHLARAASVQVHPRPGIRPLSHRKVVYRQLCCWDHALQKPLNAGEVAVDPQRGRFVFPPGEEPKGRVTVSYRYALTGQVGAGPYFRDPLPPVTITVSQTNDAAFRKIQDALNAAPTNVPVVIEIQDSHTYNEALTVKNNFPFGLVIQAASLETPVISSPGGDALTVSNLVQGTSLTVDGLTIAGGKVTVLGDVPVIKLRFCSLDPATSGIDYEPKNAGATFTLNNVITGPIKTSANVGSANINDTAVQNTVAGLTLDMASTAVSLEHVTVVGGIKAPVLMASNSILFGTVTLGAPDQSCFRYSRYPKELSGIKPFRCSTAFPIFCSFQFGHPAYLGLSANTPGEIRTGGEEGGEMGVWYAAGVPWREQNLLLKVGEYLPVGLTPVPMRAFPRTPFVGVKGI